jgi:hypothetical protein
MCNMEDFSSNKGFPETASFDVARNEAAKPVVSDHQWRHFTLLAEKLQTDSSVKD